MKHQIIQYTKFLQRSWLWIIVLFFAALTLSIDQTAWAVSIQAPYNQTVPTVTPTTEPTPVPTVTPTPAPTTASTEVESAEEEASPVKSTVQSTEQSTDLLATVSVIALNMREADDTGSSIVGTIYLDAEIEVLARNEDGTWLYICCTDEDNLPGWVGSQFVAPLFDVLQTNELVPLYQEVQAEAAEDADEASEQSASEEATENVEEESSDEDDGIADDGTADADSSIAEASASEEEITVDKPLTEVVTAELEPATLQFEMRYTPEFAWQSQLVQIEFVVTNISSNPATNVTIRDELLSNLLYVSADAESGGIVETVAGPNGGEIFTITWPELAPQQEVQAVVVVQIAPDMVSGDVVDNLAAAGADNAPAVTGGMSIGMPPELLPDFR